jgi:uncharacterized protein YjbJ (UPF0337 family)
MLYRCHLSYYNCHSRIDPLIGWRIESLLREEETMKSSTKDRAEGKFHQIKGKFKEITGKLSDNQKLKAEGVGEKIAGIVQEKVGQIDKVLWE